MISRRLLLQHLAGLPLVGGFLAGLGRTGAVANSVAAASSVGAAVPYRDYFQELGLRTFINASGTLTALSGSLMPDEVAEAIEYARHHYVRLDDVQDRVGERIAEMLGCEYATVTSGAFGSMTIGLAGVMCGMDEEAAGRLPDTTGLKNEVIVLKPENPIGYVNALSNTGATVIEVETREEMESAVNERTAMLFVFNAYNGTDVTFEEVVAVGRRHGIPTFNDAAADVPPVENLWKYTDMGFDLVAFSGGKGLRGPQSAGLLIGRRDLIEAARLHMPPRGNRIARGMKVNKEEILAMMVAVELYLEKDHAAEWALWDSQIRHIANAVSMVAGVTAEYHVPPIANHVPSLRITWDQDRVPITPREVSRLLREGHPSIETGGGQESLNLNVWMTRPGEERVIARRIRDVLTEASHTEEASR